MAEPVNIARCAEHGLHGERTECFVCGGEVEKVPMVPVRLVGKTEQETYRLRVLDAVEAIITDGASAWGTIEPLAGMFFPRVQSEIYAEMHLRGLDPVTGDPIPTSTHLSDSGDVCKPGCHGDTPECGPRCRAKRAQGD